MAEKKPIGTVLVAGAGISGIKSAIELAETGYKVILSDSSPTTGGILAKLDYQFPSDHCGICRMLPLVGRELSSEYCMRKGLFHENIEILPFTDVTALSGDSGNYTVELTRKARYVDTNKCNGCMKCIEVCPIEVDDEFNHRLTKRKAIYNAVPHNSPKLLLIDKVSCTQCGECVKVCTPGAINLEDQDQHETRKINAVVLASGVKLYNTHEFEDAKSYATSPDVVSSLAFERILSGTGTYGGDGIIKRPSDGKPAKKIAWIQCMGSRNHRQDRDYCSSICCMFALKEAVLAKEKGGDGVEATIFYMDMRTFGKGFQQYRDKAISEKDIRLIRCRVQEVIKLPDRSLQIRYFDPTTNEFFFETFDIVVLSTGQMPYQDHKKWSEIIGCSLAPNRLIATDPYNKVRVAGKQGIFLSGSLMNLTDISESMNSGIASAGEAVKFLGSLDVDTVNIQYVPEPQNDPKEESSIAVLVCRCGESSPSESIDPKVFESELSKVKGVAAVHVIDSICTEAGQEQAFELLSKSHCNRLLIGVCQPYMYRRMVNDLAKKAGFHSMLVKIFDFLGISRQGIAESDKSLFTRRVVNELKADIASLKEMPAMTVSAMEINKNALIVGGGIAGMQSALSLARRGLPVHIIEKDDKLGGFAGNNIVKTIDGLTPIDMAKQMQKLVSENTNISVHLNSRVAQTEGSFGSFETKIITGENKDTTYIHHGAAILATGGLEGKVDEYCYGEAATILTQFEMEKGLEDGSVDVSAAEDIVMIQCVGLREQGKREYCSRVCCMWAISNALRIKEKNPDTRILVLYRDVMTYGFLEQYYTKAREAGVIFVPYTLDTRPEVEIIDGKPQVKFRESVLDTDVELSPDYLVLSTGINPDPSTKEVAAAIDLPVNNDGFYEEVDSKWRPVEFQKMGIFLAGAAHSPKPLPDVIMQAEAAAQKTYSYLNQGKLTTARITSKVKDAICIRCQLCVSICPFTARSYNEMEHRIEVDSAACQGCGMCAVACRNSAAEVSGWNDRQMLSMIDTKLDEELSAV